MKSSWGWLALAAALWVPVWVPLSVWWRSDAAHVHGWLAPAFALWLALRRWQDRPEMQRTTGRGRVVANLATAGLVAAWAAALLLLVPNALWPTAHWAASVTAAGVWLAVAWSEGGRRWAGHFSWAAAFPLCAAAWPTVVQLRLFEVLSPSIAWLAAEVVNMGGRLAVAQGAVIEVTGGLVGVDEACAGLRSMEAAVLMAWFLGEYRRMRTGARIGLAAAALAVAVAGNVVRATWLVWVAAGDAHGAPQAWHDNTGLAVMGLTLAAILGISEFFQGKNCNNNSDTAVTGARRTIGIAALAAGLAVVVAGWYGSGAGGAEVTGWRMRAAPEGWRKAPAPAGTFTMLQVTHAETLDGRGSGWQGQAHLFDWSGDVARQEVAFQHGPDICLPSIGAKREAELGEQLVLIDGREVPWRLERYVTTGGRRQHVWLMRWDGWRDEPVTAGRWGNEPTAMRLAAVCERRTEAAMTTLVVVALGFTDDETAGAWFAEWAPRLLERR